MHSAEYYREQAEKARRLAHDVATPAATDVLEKMAEDYDDIADDLQDGAVEIRHPELMKQPWSKTVRTGLRAPPLALSLEAMGGWSNWGHRFEGRLALRLFFDPFGFLFVDLSEEPIAVRDIGVVGFGGLI